MSEGGDGNKDTGLFSCLWEPPVLLRALIEMKPCASVAVGNKEARPASDTARALQSSQNLLTKHALHRKVSLPDHPQMVWNEAGVSTWHPGARVSTHNSQKLEWSDLSYIKGFYSGSFKALQIVNAQALGFNELVNFKRRFQWPT